MYLDPALSQSTWRPFLKRSSPAQGVCFHALDELTQLVTAFEFHEADRLGGALRAMNKALIQIALNPLLFTKPRLSLLG